MRYHMILVVAIYTYKRNNTGETYIFTQAFDPKAKSGLVNMWYHLMVKVLLGLYHIFHYSKHVVIISTQLQWQADEKMLKYIKGTIHHVRHS